MYASFLIMISGAMVFRIAVIKMQTLSELDDPDLWANIGVAGAVSGTAGALGCAIGLMLRAFS